MARNLDEHECQICLRHFSSDKELQKHIKAFQSRARHLFTELQKCFAHIDSDLSDEEDCGVSDNDDDDDDDDPDNRANNDCDGLKKHQHQCPHMECDDKRPRASFSWKNLLRHYTIHVPCRETCEFCGLNINRVRKYVTHLDNCKTKNRQKRDLGAAQELKLKASTRANTSDEESQGISSRKRARETADPDPDPENVHQSRKPRTTKEDGDATVLINSDSSYQAPGTEGVTTELATPDHFGMSSHSAFIPTHRGVSRPSHCDLNKSTALSNARTYTSGGTDFLQYPLGSEETFMGGQYMGTFGGEPPQFSHTMDRSANYPGQEYGTTTHARSHTMDGLSGVSAERYETAGLYRAPLFTSHTLDGFYQNVYPYETSTQAMVPPAEYDKVDSRQSDTQLTNEETTALYGTLQTAQMFVPATVRYG